MRRLLSLLVFLLLTSCAEPALVNNGYVDLCRPANTPPGRLGIGDMTVAAGSMSVRLDARGESGWYGIQIALDPDAADRLAQVTRENVGRPLLLSLDGEVIAEPVVQTPILDGRLLITGNFTRHEAGLIVERLSGPCLTGEGSFAPAQSRETDGAGDGVADQALQQD